VSNPTDERLRLAIVTTHPIQYYAPWFRWIVANTGIELRVFYLWDFGVTQQRDPGFGRTVEWDVPLLEGYDYEFVPNTSARPGTDRFFGIRNPELGARVKRWKPDAALLIGYKYATMMRLIFSPFRQRQFPLLFRGDSHRLEARGQRSEVRGQRSEIRSQKPRGEGQRSEVSLPGRSLGEGWRAEGGKNRRSKFEIRNWLISAIYKRFAAFLYVGQANREYFQIHGVPDSKLFFSPHAVDTERLMAEPEKTRAAAAAWRRELGIPPDHLVILFAGKFEEKKRPLDLLEAFRLLNEPDVSLLFVGSGHLEQELRERAAPVPNVFFAPFQNQSNMPRTYAACDLFVLPSFGPEESWGLAINEALCLARPVIVSDHVGCGPDLVEPGGNGLVFPAGDVKALTAALQEAMRDREQLRRWGTRGREIVSRYDFASATRGLMEGLESVTGKPSTRK
jgi:glycosyltransferase involved in cell wall biosynthesis